MLSLSLVSPLQEDRVKKEIRALAECLTILEPQKLSIIKFYVFRKRRTTYFEALTWLNVRSRRTIGGWRHVAGPKEGGRESSNIMVVVPPAISSSLVVATTDLMLPAILKMSFQLTGRKDDGPLFLP